MSNRGYETPVMADVETAYRRLLRFQLKLVLIFVALLVVVGGIVLLNNRDESRSATVPNLRGLDTAGAASTLRRAGLAPDYLSFDQASETITFGRVISTDPPAGVRLDRGAVIKVTISCGAPQPGICNP